MQRWELCNESMVGAGVQVFVSSDFEIFDSLITTKLHDDYATRPGLSCQHDRLRLHLLFYSVTR